MQNETTLKKKAKIFKALGHPTRLWMVEQLAGGERCVCEFVEAMDVDFSTISRHLSVLRSAGIVKSKRRGKSVYYTLLLTCLVEATRCIDMAIDGTCQCQQTLGA